MNVNSASQAVDFHGGQAAWRLSNPDGITRKRLAETTIDGLPQQTESRQPGVIRNLVNGHFRGVADVRLRLNFHAELRAIEQQNQLPILRDGAARLVDALAAEIESVADLDAPALNLEDAQQPIDQLRSDLAELFTAERDDPVTIDDLRQAATDFLLGLRDLLQPATTQTSDPQAGTIQVLFPPDVAAFPPTELVDPPADTQKVVPPDVSVPPAPSEPALTNEPTESPEYSLGVFLDNLASVVDGHLSELQVLLAEASLPEPTAPRGNGVAFEKFMAVYRANQQSASS